jgi:hypothetical protein
MTISFSLRPLLDEARKIWKDYLPMSVSEISVALTVVTGDIARIARQLNDLGTYGDASQRALKKELGNLILSSVRWMDDLGFDSRECLTLARDAQTDIALMLAEYGIERRDPEL